MLITQTLVYSLVFNANIRFIPPFFSTIAAFAERSAKCFSVALSGGVDSVVLLHLMNQVQKQRSELKLEAVYVNHGLSEYADEWQGFCKSLCEDLGVAFKAVRVEIQERSRTSLEAQAREARYQALDENCEQAVCYCLVSI